MIFLVVFSFTNTNIKLIIWHSDCQVSSLLCKRSGKWYYYNSTAILQKKKLKQPQNQVNINNKNPKQENSLDFHGRVGSKCSLPAYTGHNP